MLQLFGILYKYMYRIGQVLKKIQALKAKLVQLKAKSTYLDKKINFPFFSFMPSVQCKTFLKIPLVGTKERAMFLHSVTQ